MFCCCTVIAWHTRECCPPSQLHGPILKCYAPKQRQMCRFYSKNCIWFLKNESFKFYWWSHWLLNFPPFLLFLSYLHLLFLTILWPFLPAFLWPSSGLWVRGALIPTCWTCKAAPTRRGFAEAHFSMLRSCMKTLKWPERWSSTFLTWQWRPMRRSTRSCPCSASRLTTLVSNSETEKNSLRREFCGQLILGLSTESSHWPPLQGNPCRPHSSLIPLGLVVVFFEAIVGVVPMQACLPTHYL